MTPIEKMRAEMEAERKAKRAAQAAIDDMMQFILDKMPDCAARRNGQILVLRGKIMNQLEDLIRSAAKAPEEAFDDQQSRQVLDYLTCVYVGMQEFCKQMGIEVADGAS